MLNYHGESMYSSEKSKQVIQKLRDEDLVKDLHDGRKVVDLDENNRVTIIKSDGTSLYITRDIAAALDIREKFGFDKMIYVVESAQGHHFPNFFRTLSRLGCGWSQECQHVKEDSGHQHQEGEHGGGHGDYVGEPESQGIQEYLERINLAILKQLESLP